MPQNVSEPLDEFDAAWSEMWQRHSEWRMRGSGASGAGLTDRAIAVQKFQEACAKVVKLAVENGIDPGPIVQLQVNTTNITMEQREAAVGLLQALRGRAMVTPASGTAHRRRGVNLSDGELVERLRSATQSLKDDGTTTKNVAKLIGISDRTLKRRANSSAIVRAALELFITKSTALDGPDHAGRPLASRSARIRSARKQAGQFDE